MNLKNLIYYPFLFSGITVKLSEMIHTKDVAVLCGIPMGALPISTNLSLLTSIPQMMVRNNKKIYGTKKQIETIKHSNKQVILIEDVITTGSSVKEIKEILEYNGYTVIQIICIVFRGTTPVIDKIPIQYLFTLSDLQNQIKPPLPLMNDNIRHLNHLIELKQSNIIVAYDKVKGDIFQCLEQINPHIIGVKIHNEILQLSSAENERLFK